MEKVDLKTKTALVWDFGIFTEMAARLARDFKKVYYFVPWADAFPKATKALIGNEFDGIERVLDFWDYVDKVDLIACFDTHAADILKYIDKHKNAGQRVFGAKEETKLELDRYLGRQIQKKVGLPTQKTIKIKGLDNLREYLANHNDLFIKINIFRGEVETFFHKDYEWSETLLDHIAHEMGPKQHEMEFILEEAKKGVEPGSDLILSGGEFLNFSMYGYEIKGSGYIAKVGEYKDMPPAVKIINEKLKPIFKELKASTFFSTEFIIGEDRKPYLIDPTVRCAAPVVSHIQLELIENWSEVIWACAGGENIEVKYKYKYAAGTSLETEWANKNWTKVSIPSELRRWTKLRMTAKFGDDYYMAPGLSSVGSVIALGDSVKEVMDIINKRAEEIKAYMVDRNVGATGLLLKEIEEGKKFGIDF